MESHLYGLLCVLSLLQVCIVISAPYWGDFTFCPSTSTGSKGPLLEPTADFCPSLLEKLPTENHSLHHAQDLNICKEVHFPKEGQNLAER